MATKIPFDTVYTRSQKSKDFTSNIGSPIVEDYAYIGEEGKKVLAVVGTHDLQEEIQSYADSCDINVIVKRFLAGDESALNQREGFYADMTKMPKTYAEWFEKYQAAENYFNMLPVDIRNKFNHSVTEFWSDFGTDHWIEAMGMKEEKSEVIEDAEK